MTDGQALLAAVLADPGDDTPRLVYADKFEEDGEVERAAFIRIQCEYARLHPHLEKHGSDECSLCERGRELSELLLGKYAIRRNEPAWFAADCPWHIAGMKDYHGEPVEWDWHRGFVGEIRGPSAAVLPRLDAILAAHPATAVRLTTEPEQFPEATTMGDSGIRRFVVAGREVSIETGAMFNVNRGTYENPVWEPADVRLNVDPIAILSARWPSVRTWELPGQVGYAEFRSELIQEMVRTFGIPQQIMTTPGTAAYNYVSARLAERFPSFSTPVDPPR